MGDRTHVHCNASMNRHVLSRRYLSSITMPLGAYPAWKHVWARESAERRISSVLPSIDTMASHKNGRFVEPHPIFRLGSSTFLGLLHSQSHLSRRVRRPCPNNVTLVTCHIRYCGSACFFPTLRGVIGPSRTGVISTATIQDPKASGLRICIKEGRSG
ncbi:hypothetical protein BDZ97DRAFT_117068 [Flammula alnicola]|nr:hypothetical protein BDZ97DRAFT_117068 [Flammula alnicola]